MSTVRISLRNKKEVDVPTGEYQLAIFSAYYSKDRFGGLRVRWSIIGGEHDGTEFTSRVFPEQIENLQAALGLERGGQPEPDRLLGGRILGTVELRADRRKGHSYLTVRTFNAVGLAESSSQSNDGA